MLAQKFPKNWSYGHLYEFLKENWSKKLKDSDSYLFDHENVNNNVMPKRNFDLSCLPKNPA